MNLRCSAHGLLPWLGQGECADCGKIYKRILEAPEKCTCGVRLLPLGSKAVVERIFTARGSSSFTARAMCSKCFEGHDRSGLDTLPPDSEC